MLSIYIYVCIFYWINSINIIRLFKFVYNMNFEKYFSQQIRHTGLLIILHEFLYDENNKVMTFMIMNNLNISKNM